MINVIILAAVRKDYKRSSHEPSIRDNFFMFTDVM